MFQAFRQSAVLYRVLAGQKRRQDQRSKTDKRSDLMQAAESSFTETDNI
jgi:hypothetical protein